MKASRSTMEAYRRAGESHPKLSRGRVWCPTCGRTYIVNAGECLRLGWPECCGETMTIDAPAERSAQ